MAHGLFLYKRVVGRGDPTALFIFKIVTAQVYRQKTVG